MAFFVWVALAGKGAEPPSFRDKKKVHLLVERGRAEAYIAMEIKVLCIYETSVTWYLCTYYLCFTKQKLTTSLAHLVQHKDISTTT